MAEIPTLELATATLEELEERLARVREDKSRCGECSKSYCTGRYNLINGKELSYCGSDIVKTIEAIIAVRKNQENTSVKGSCNGTCEKCKMLDRTILESGYPFCKHWHNFTAYDGFCFMYSGEDELELTAE